MSAEGGRPVLQLDDLMVLLRNATDGDAVFGCSINPHNENLAKLKEFVEQSTKQPLKAGQREAWVQRQRELVGAQDIVVFGIDPRTRVARTIVEADYRMKLIGMGLEPGVLGVTSYLESRSKSVRMEPFRRSTSSAGGSRSITTRSRPPRPTTRSNCAANA